MSAHAVLAPEMARPGRRTRVQTCETDAAHEHAPPRAPEAPIDSLELLAAQWQRAFDAADRALIAAVGTLPAPYLEQRRRALGKERRQTAELLVGVARVHGIRRPWRFRRCLAARPLTP